jgi:hypothetical protein
VLLVLSGRIALERLLQRVVHARVLPAVGSIVPVLALSKGCSGAQLCARSGMGRPITTTRRSSHNIREIRRRPRTGGGNAADFDPDRRPLPGSMKDAVRRTLVFRFAR